MAYKRVLLKLSGEALSKGAEQGCIINFDFALEVCKIIKECRDMGVEIAIVVGGGNIWRGGKNGMKMNRSRADSMGMLATVINSLALQEVFEEIGVESVVMTSVDMKRIAEPFTQREADKHLSEGKIVIFGGGTGCPYFSTDTGAVLRGAEIGADIVLMAKNVDHIYDKDPGKNPDAKALEEITYTDILKNDLKAIDATAAAFCRDHGIKVLCFGLKDPENIIRAVKGEKIGTILK